MYLNTHSYYSLRYGTMPVEKIVDEAKRHGISALALTDINNTMGVMDFIKACSENDIKPIAGIEFRNENTYLYTALARNNEGFLELNDFLTVVNKRKEPPPPDPPPFRHTYIVYPFGTKKPSQLLDNELVGIRPHETRKLISSEFRHRQSKLLVWQPVSFEDKEDYEIHRHLRAIDNNILLSQLSPAHLAAENEIMQPVDQLLSSFEGYPEIIRNTEKVIDNCSVEFDFGTIKNRQTFTGNRYDDKLLLEKLANDGMVYRYGKNNQEAIKRVRHELEIIDRLGFSSYFLITWDIIRYSMSRGFYHVGRGSGANSVVAYCLRITDVDPIELDLYFERFINPRRTSPPDFDIDYSWKERDEVLDYIFKRYSERYTALLGTISTFRDRSIIRELGKVYGLPKQEIDQLVQYPHDMLDKDHITKQILHIGQQIMDFPNQRSIHAGGVLISEKPITWYTALDMPPKGMQTTQWDMYVAEEIGFEKLDILSQRGIGHIKECVDIIYANRGTKIDVHQVEKFKTDPKTCSQLCNGETNGCFYIESPAMRGLLKKLKCDDYITLVAASSIIRPGVAKSGMMREYIWRFHHPEEFKYIHPVMEEQLKETFGVMVYQEDVIKVCHHFAGLDLADADVLRRAMSGKFRSRNEFDRIAGKYIENCREKGYPDEIAKEVWRQIESFSGYSFSKAHSASYAVESYQSLYLKAHFPLEFMVAVINNFGGFYRTWVYVNEARRCGATIHLPCINRSTYKTCIYGKDIFLGFVHLANLETTVANEVIREREGKGEYKSLENFVRRVHTGLEQLIILIRIDAFRFTGKTKKILLWEAHMLLGQNTGPVHGNRLFREPEKKFQLPKLEQSRIEDAYDEIELLGFPISMSAFDLLKTPFRGEIMAEEMLKNKGKKVRMVGNLVTIKNVKTVNREWMHFGAFLDAKGEFFDTVHFPRSLKDYPFRGYGVYLILGKVEEEMGFPSLTVEKMAKLPVKEDPRY
ncbi:MAG: DNA polymerase III subunit alpha [Bacteroides sp. SM23_62_1]|nr:MAG: DNA polymerase III subunit alpha [Bacteroides sp. SM23_62_1]